MESQIQTVKKNPGIFLIVGIIVLIVLGGVFYGANRSQSTPAKSTNPISSNILYVTTPVNTISGKITAISNNVINLEVTRSNSKNTVIYKITVSPQTRITHALIDGTIQNLSLKDIQAGNYIIARADTDLRTLSTSEFTASEISLPPVRSSFVGYVTAINGNVISIKADISPITIRPGETTVPTPKDYLVNVDQNTLFIFYIAPAAPGIQPQARIVSLKDIAAHAPVTVYTSTDIDSTNQVTATKIAEFLGPQPSNASGSAVLSK